MRHIDRFIDGHTLIKPDSWMIFPRSEMDGKMRTLEELLDTKGLYLNK